MISRRELIRSLQDDELPEPVKDCEKSIREDNPDMDRSTAIAICRDMNQRGVLSDYLAAAPTDSRVNQRAMAEFRNPAEIRRVDEGTGVRYKRVMLLSPGTWADAGSEEFVDYNADAIRKSADNWVNLEAIRSEIPNWHDLTNERRAERLAEMNEHVMLQESAPINFLHGPAMYGAETLDEIGEIPLDSIIVDDHGRLYADLVLDGDSPQSKTAIDLIDEVLEAAQAEVAEPPPVGPSVEIPADHVSVEDGTKSLEEAFFSAVGIVFGPASRPVELGEQAQERAVAMTGADTDNHGVVLRDGHGNQEQDCENTDSTSKSVPRHRRGMQDFDPESMNDEELAETLRTMQEDMGELRRVLQDLGVVQNIVEQAKNDGFDPSASTVSELVEFINDNMDVDDDVMAELQDAADAYLETVDADSLDATSAEGMLDWVVQQSGAGDDEDSEMGTHDDDDQEAMMELEQVKEVVGEVAEHMGDIKDMLQERESEREESLDELERRLSELEGEPIERSLTGQQDSGEFIDEDDDRDTDADDTGTTGRPIL